MGRVPGYIPGIQWFVCVLALPFSSSGGRLQAGLSAADTIHMKVTTLACVFVSKDGQLSIRLVEPPLPLEYQVPTIPPGMAHAARALGLPAEIRTFKRTAADGMPMYEEV